MAIDAPQTIGACWDMTLKLDLTGLNCPLFAIKTRKDLKSLTPVDRLEVGCTNPLAAIDIPHLVVRLATGWKASNVTRGGIVFFKDPRIASKAVPWSAA